MNTFTNLFLIALLISNAVHFWLAFRHGHYVAEHRAEVPAAFKAKVPLAAHQKAADYTQAKLVLGNIDTVISIVVLLLMTLGGGINEAFALSAATISDPLWSGVVALAGVFLVLTVIEIPTSLYQTFVLEEKFGFNKSTAAQFVKDQLLALVLGAVIGAVVARLVFHGDDFASGNVAFNLLVSPGLMLKGVAIAAFIGAVGALFPASRAARLPVATALQIR